MQTIVIFDTPIKHSDGNRWCHLTSNDINYLHTFAKKIGLKKEWFQNKEGKPHYDIKSDIIRHRAIINGASMVERRHFFNKIEEWHSKRSY